METEQNRESNKENRIQTSCAILTAFPPSVLFQDYLSTSLGKEPNTISIYQLKEDGILELFQKLRKINPQHLIVALEPNGDIALLPVLQIAAILSKAKTFSYLDQDAILHTFNRFIIFALAVQFTNSFCIGAYDTWRANWQLRSLIKSPRKKSATTQGTVLYVRTNNRGASESGGAIAHTVGVINAMIDMGKTVVFASPAVLGEMISRSQFLALPNLKNFSLPTEFNLYRQNYSAIKALKSLAKNQNFSLVYQRLTLGNWVGVSLSRYFNIPLVIEYNGSEVWITKNWGKGFLFERIAKLAEDTCLHHADLIVTVSENLQNDLLSRGIDESRILTHPNGVDVDVFDPERFSKKEINYLKDRLGIPRDACVVTFIGTFGQWHGVEVFAEAIAKLHKENGDWVRENKVHFFAIGDGVKRPRVEEILAEYTDNVTFTGLIPNEEAPLYLAASDIFVSPHIQNSDGSAFFGSPTKLFEYLAMGRPVVASNVEQIGKILEGSPKVTDVFDDMPSPNDEACGMLVKPERPDELCLGIQFLVNNPKWRKAAGKNARHMAIDRYTWKHHVSAIFNALIKLKGTQ
ncbi:MAG: glycosyltransferase family 4 protein [Rhodospirillales bacterium]|nr:glycosyltransferase family 4 protein [Rhodospirillales bacterium]